jgi:hypothetical protein
MTCSRDISGEERAYDCGSAKDGPGAHDSCFGVHGESPYEFALSVRFIDNECSGDELDTSKTQMMDAVDALAPSRRGYAASFGCQF